MQIDDMDQRRQNKHSDRPKLSGESLTTRSRITNGSALLDDVDGRSAWARRFRDLLEGYEADLGGVDALSEGQRALARRAALLQTELEFQEGKFARLRADGMVPAPYRLEGYGRAANTLRRLIESLELHRGPKARAPVDITDQVVEHVRGMAR